MASFSSIHFLLSCFLLFPMISLSTAKTTSFRPKALVVPVTKVTKDLSTSQHIIEIKQRTPLVPVKLTVDVGGNFIWVDCEKGYVSSSYKPARCGSAPCKLAQSTVCGVNDTCSLFPFNPLIGTSTDGAVGSDVFEIQSTDGFNPGRVVSVPKLLFTCGPTSLLKGLVSGVTGIAGLGGKKIGPPSQFASAFRFNRKFAVCLSSSARSKGAIFFGNEPYVFLPNIDVSKNLIYTPLIVNPVPITGYADFFIGVKGIKINGKPVAVNTTLLSIDSEGYGGTRISTVAPYTSLETSIYNAVVDAFVKELGNKVTRVAAVAPFGACFSSNNIGSTRAGPTVPTIDLVLQNKNVHWSIFGANSVVRVSRDVLCLGFVDGGPLVFVDYGVKYSPTAIVIGGHQIEDNLLQFDLVNSRLGFSSALLFRQTTCSNFNFTSTA